MTRGCRVSRPPKHDLMGQHRRANPRIYQPLVKKSQSPFPRNDPRALQYQGSWRAAPSLWDDSDFKSQTGAYRLGANGVRNPKKKRPRLKPDHPPEFHRGGGVQQAQRGFHRQVRGHDVLGRLQRRIDDAAELHHAGIGIP